MAAMARRAHDCPPRSRGWRCRLRHARTPIADEASSNWKKPPCS